MFSYKHFTLQYWRAWCLKMYNTRARWKVLGLLYNRCEIRDKRLLGRFPDRSWCHRLTSVKLFCSQSIAPCPEFHVGCRLGRELFPFPTYLLSMEPGAAVKSPLVSMAVPSAPVRIPSQRPLGLSVTSVTSVANDKSDNELILGAVHRSPALQLRKTGRQMGYLPPNDVGRIT